MHILFAYDIADPRRLRRVAYRFERHAIRCQKSVFLFRGSLSRAFRILDDVARLLDLDKDCVQMWRLQPGQEWLGEVRGRSPLLAAAAAILDPHQRCPVLTRPQRSGARPHRPTQPSPHANDGRSKHVDPMSRKPLHDP